MKLDFNEIIHDCLTGTGAKKATKILNSIKVRRLLEKACPKIPTRNVMK